MRNVIVCSCDTIYFNAYAPALIKSAEIARIPTYINIINPVNDDIEYAKQMMEWSHTKSYDLTLTYSELDIPNNNLSKIYYACDRINILISYIESKKEVMNLFALDVDSLVMNPFRFPVSSEKPLGFYFRNPTQHGASNEWEKRGMRLLGSFFVNSTMLPYLKRVKMFIDNIEKRWFIDQVALYEAMTAKELKEAYDFSNDKILGWNVDNPRECTVLTGKGDRKYLDKYKSLQQEFDTMIFNELAEVCK